MHGKPTAALVLGLGVSLGLCLSAGPAAARWTIHDEANATQVLDPPGGTDGQVCAGRLRAESGWVAIEDPETYVPPADRGAYDAVRYQVWRAPSGFSTFAGSSSVVDTSSGEVVDYIFTDDAGGEHHATKVADVVAPARRLLRPPEATDIESEFVFTKAAFSADLTGSVGVGEVLGLRPDFGHPGSDQEADSLVDLTVVDCGFTVQSGQYSARTGQRVTLDLGRITGPGRPADYAAKIAWGDGSANSTGVVRQAGGALVVAGTHRYGHRGDYAVHVTVKQLYTGTKHTATGQVRVRS
jgi:hypothetical protein